EVQPTDRTGGRHRKALSQMNAYALFRLQQIEQQSFLRVIGLRRITGRGPDAAVTLLDQILGLQIFIPTVAPLLARALVQQFGEGFGQAVRQRLGHNRVVIVQVTLESGAELFEADARGDGEAADVIDPPALLRSDEVSQRLIVLAGTLFDLLSQRVEDGQNARTIFIGVDLNVVADRIRRPEAVNRVSP